MARFRNIRTGDVITADGPVADNYNKRPNWRRLTAAAPTNSPTVPAGKKRTPRRPRTDTTKE